MMPMGQPVKGQKAGGVGVLVAQILYLVIHVLMLVFWITFLAGIARTQDYCIEVKADLFSNLLGYRPKKTTPSARCGMYLSLFWYVCFFQLACIVLAILCCWQRLRNVLLRATTSFFCIVIAMLSILAYIPVLVGFVMDQQIGSDGVPSKINDGVKAAEAGGIGLLVVDFVWLIMAVLKDGAYPPGFPLCGCCSDTSSTAAGQPASLQGSPTMMQVVQMPDGKTVMMHSPAHSAAFPPGALTGPYQQQPPMQQQGQHVQVPIMGPMAPARGM